MAIPEISQKGISILDRLPCTLPNGNIPEDVDIESVCQPFCDKLADLKQDDFAPYAIWRDTFSLTGTLRTLYYSAFISSTWSTLCQRRDATAFRLHIKSAQVVRPNAKLAWVNVSFTFEMREPLASSCLGFLRLVPDENGNWKVWIMCTMLDQLRDYSDVDRLDPVGSGSLCLDRNDGDQHQSSLANGHTQQQKYNCVVIGAGQAGLSTAGRLKALGVSYVCIERNDEVGDNWRLRYDSVKLHTTRESSHLPFDRTFTPDYPEMLTKDDLARGFKGWVEKFGINVWLSTTVESGSWDEPSKQWTLQLRRRGIASTESELLTITSSHVVLALGGGCQIPIIPEYANRETFRGIAMHSRDYRNALAWKGKHGVIVGTANTAHDVAEDMVDAGLVSVTMIQRSKTYVMSYAEHKHWSNPIFNAGTPTPISDIKCFLGPIALSRKLGLAGTRAAYAADPERYAGLEKAGFLLDRENEIAHHLLGRFGGHYVDIGASQRIAEGQIKIKSGSLPVSYTEDGLLFADGSHLKADVIVFTTGFDGNMRNAARQLFGGEVADKIDDYWGIDNEGEIRGAFKPTGHPGLWYNGGGIAHARFYSRFIALQIKAMIEGKPFPIFSAKQSNLLA